jgi:Ankyrin repeats (3 copies)
MWASARGHADCVSLLLSAKANVGLQDSEYGFTGILITVYLHVCTDWIWILAHELFFVHAAFLWATFKQHVEIQEAEISFCLLYLSYSFLSSRSFLYFLLPLPVAQMLLKSGADISSLFKWQMKVTARRAEPEVFEMWVKRPVHLAVSKGNLSQVVFLLDEMNGRQRVDDADDHGETFSRFLYFVVDVLNVKRSPKGWTALGLAVYLNRVDIVKALLERGANPRYISKDCCTPLRIATSLGLLHIVDLLLPPAAPLLLDSI